MNILKTIYSNFNFVYVALYFKANGDICPEISLNLMFMSLDKLLEKLIDGLFMHVDFLRQIDKFTLISKSTFVEIKGMYVR